MFGAIIYEMGQKYIIVSGRGWGELETINLIHAESHCYGPAIDGIRTWLLDIHMCLYIRSYVYNISIYRTNVKISFYWS